VLGEFYVVGSGPPQRWAWPSCLEVQPLVLCRSLGPATPVFTYHACLLKGVLSKVGGASPTCIKGAKVISWNSTGPQGPKGARAPRVPLAHRDRPVRLVRLARLAHRDRRVWLVMQATCIPTATPSLRTQGLLGWVSVTNVGTGELSTVGLSASGT